MLRPVTALFSWGSVSCLFLLSVSSCKKNDSGGSAPPVIHSFSPATAAENDTIVLKGQDFSPERSKNTVKFLQKEAEVVEASATQLKVIVPEDAPDGKISVSVNGKTDSTDTPFTLDISKPVLKSFSPLHGEEGSEITIKVKNLAENAEVRFGIVPKTYTRVDATTIKIKAGNGGDKEKISIYQNDIEYTFKETFKVTNTWVGRGYYYDKTYNWGVTFVLNDKIYFGLGYASGSGISYHHELKVYDPETNKWSDGPALPAAFKGRAYAMAFVHQGKVYIGGGHSFDNYGGSLQDWWEWDPAGTGDAAWKRKGDLPGPLQNGVGAVLNDKIYAGLGGSHNMYSYDFSTHTWKDEGNMNVPVIEDAFSFVADNILYIGGGYDNATGSVVYNNNLYKFQPPGGGTVASLSVYDRLPHSIIQKQGVSLNGKCYILQGNLREYDPVNRSWTILAGEYNASNSSNITLVKGRLFAWHNNLSIFEYIFNE